MIEREELVNDLANVLAEHRFYQAWDKTCECGWMPSSAGEASFLEQHTDHVAEQLAQCIERGVLR